MNKLSKRVALAAMGSGAMLISSVGMAAGTALPSLFTIDTAGNAAAVIAGTLTDCPAGSTCQDLPGTSPGIVMRSVHNTVLGTDYIQTIIAEDTVASGTFANEQLAQQGIQGAQDATNIAQKMVMNDGTGFTANHTFVGDGYAALVPGGTVGDPWYVLNQSIVGSGVTLKVRVEGTIDSGDGNVGDAGNNRRVYIDQVGVAPEFGEFRYRWANNPGTVPAATDLYQGTSGGLALAGVAGTNLGALYIHQSVVADLNKVDPGNANDFGMLKFFGAGDAVGTASNFVTSGSADPTARFEMDLLTPTALTLAADSTDGYGLFEAGDPAVAIFGALGDMTDFNTSFMP